MYSGAVKPKPNFPKLWLARGHGYQIYREYMSFTTSSAATTPLHSPSPCMPMYACVSHAISKHLYPLAFLKPKGGSLHCVLLLDCTPPPEKPPNQPL